MNFPNMVWPFAKEPARNSGASPEPTAAPDQLPPDSAPGPSNQSEVAQQHPSADAPSEDMSNHPYIATAVKRKADDDLDEQVTHRRAARNHDVEERLKRIQQDQETRVEEMKESLFRDERLNGEDVQTILDNHRQNQRSAGRMRHLLGLPPTVQRRIFSYVLLGSHDNPSEPYQVEADGKLAPKPATHYSISWDFRLTEEDKIQQDGTPKFALPGLLSACHQLRNIAKPIFLVGNDFVMNVRDFNTKPLEAFWSRYMMEQTKVQENGPIVLCDVTVPTNQPPTPRATFSGTFPTPYLVRRLQNLRPVEEGQGRNFVIHGHPGLMSLTHLRRGSAKLNVVYEPNWKNMMSWLRAYYDERLPPIAFEMLADTDGNSKNAVKLERVAVLFATVESYRIAGEPWSAAEKALYCQRAMMVFEDPAWGRDVTEDEVEPAEVPLPGNEDDPYADLKEALAHDDEHEDDVVDDEETRGILEQHASTPGARPTLTPQIAGHSGGVQRADFTRSRSAKAGVSHEEQEHQASDAITPTRPAQASEDHIIPSSQSPPATFARPTLPSGHDGPSFPTSSADPIFAAPEAGRKMPSNTFRGRTEQAAQGMKSRGSDKLSAARSYSPIRKEKKKLGRKLWAGRSKNDHEVNDSASDEDYDSNY